MNISTLYTEINNFVSIGGSRWCGNNTHSTHSLAKSWTVDMYSISTSSNG